MNIDRWLHAPATNGDALIIALLVAWLLSLMVGSRAEREAKRHADEVYDRLKKELRYRP